MHLSVCCVCWYLCVEWCFPEVPLQLKLISATERQKKPCMCIGVFDWGAGIICFLFFLVVTGRTPLARQRVWRSQCRAMTCQRWVERLGGGGWLSGAGLVPLASSPLSCCVGKTEHQHISKYTFVQDSFSYSYSNFFRVIRNALYVEALKCSQSLFGPQLFCSGSTLM